MDLQQLDPGALTLGVQLGVVSLIAIFFAVLSRSIRLVEIRVWAMAWLAELVSVALALSFVGLGQPAGAPLGRILLAGFVVTKSYYAAQLMRGTRIHFAPGATRVTRPLDLAIVSLGAGVAVIAPPVPIVLSIQWLVVAALVGTAARFALRSNERGRQRWLGWVLLAAGLLYVVYVAALVPSLLWAAPTPQFFDFSSLLDAAIDLILALSLLIAFESIQSRRLIELNERLLNSNDRLQLLADSDPLTGLRNRRAARAYVESIGDQATSVVFFDINDFKAVNDDHGHAVGDASLVHVANVLARGFRPDDGLFRWGGDEFVVVAPGLSRENAGQRMRHVERELAAGSRDLPKLSVSYGVSAGRAFDAFANLLHQADEEMYLVKRRRQNGSFAMESREPEHH